MEEFKRTFTGVAWEQEVGYCRALRAGNQIFVTGCAPVEGDGSVHAPGNAYAQARRSLEIIESALSDLGADRRNVVRTRMFVTDIGLWREFGRAHREFFSACPPTTSMLEINALISPEVLIEVEADAVVL